MAEYTSMLIGHTTLDTNTDHLGNTVKIVGGAVIYSSASAHALGHRVLVVTKIADKDMNRLEQFTIPKEDIICLPCEKSMDLVNVYHTADKERRTCTCLSKGDPFKASEIPEADVGIYHLAGLVYGDFDSELIISLSKKAPVALDVQAMLRHVNEEDGSMYFEDWSEKLNCLPYVTYLKTDAAEAEIMTGCSDRKEAAKHLYSWGAKEIMITHNTEVLIYDGKDFYTCPIKSRNLSGRTGRGDTTFAAYINERVEGVSIPDALLTASATVSLKMETPGPFKGTREDIENYIKELY